MTVLSPFMVMQDVSLWWNDPEWTQTAAYIPVLFVTFSRKSAITKSMVCFIYLFMYLFYFIYLLREKTFFQRYKKCCLFIKAIKCCEMISKKFLARIVHCPKYITMTKRKWQIVSLHIDTCLIALISPVWRMHLNICSFKHICFISV